MANLIFITIFLVLTAVILISAWFSPIPRKIGFRNVKRRLGNTVLVILGSLVGSALIAGSLVLSDSLDKTFLGIVEKFMGESDATIQVKEKTMFASAFAYINEGETEQIKSMLQSPDIDGILPSLSLKVSPQKVDEAGIPVINVYNADLRGINVEDFRGFGTAPQEITDLNNNEAVVSESLAKKLELSRGDSLRVIYGELKIDMRVKEIYPDKGLYGGKTIFTSNKFLTTELGLPNNSFNSIGISARGGIRPDNYNGKEFKSKLDSLMSGFESDRIQLSAYEWKQDLLNGYGIKQFVIIFIALSFFGILAGILLIVNLYSMLAEERKVEMGVLRAIALSQRDLTKTFVYEGFLYSLISSLLGSFIGIGIGYFLVLGLGKMFEQIMASSGDADYFSMVFGLKAQSIIIAFCTGFFITIATTFFASRKISKLRIIEALRDIKDEKLPKISAKWIIKTFLHLLLLLVSVCSLLSFFGIRNGLETMRSQGGDKNYFSQMTPQQFDDFQNFIQIYLLYTGLVMSVFLGVSLFNKIVKQFFKKDPSRVTVSIACIFNIIFTVYLINLESFIKASQQNIGAVLFFLSSVVLVISLSLLITSNLNIITNILEFILRRFDNLRAVVKIALRYPNESRSRTGLTLVMFALIIFLIAYISMVKATVQKENVKVLKNSLGGYDLLIAPASETTSSQINSMDTDLSSLSSVAKVADIYQTLVTLPEYKYKDLPETMYWGDPTQIPDHTSEDAFRSFYNALPIEFIKNSQIKLQERTPAYSSDEEVWNAIVSDGSKVVIGAAFGGQGFGQQPSLKVGQKIQIADIGGERQEEKEIIGLIKSDTNSGPGMSLYSYIITTNENLAKQLDVSYIDKYSSKSVLVLFSGNADKSIASNDVRKQLINYNIANIIELEDMTGQALAFINIMMTMLQGFLAFSLIVGISGLSIIILRAVHERRQQIGMLRSLGFQRWMILASFTIESTFITLLGIVIGLSMGTIGALMAFAVAYKDQPDVKPIFPVGEIALICALVYLSSMIFSLLPAIKAARLRPVEATNYPV